MLSFLRSLYPPENNAPLPSDYSDEPPQKSERTQLLEYQHVSVAVLRLFALETQRNVEKAALW